MDFFKIAAIVSPIISAIIAGWVTFYFIIKSKKFDLLYQNRIPAYKEVINKLVNFKNFCSGRIAFFQGNEYSPFYERNTGALFHRTEIANSSEQNSAFLTNESRSEIENLINEMSLLCSAEVALIVNNDKELGILGAYESLLNKTDKCIQFLYSDLNLKI